MLGVDKDLSSPGSPGLTTDGPNVSSPSVSVAEDHSRVAVGQLAGHARVGQRVQPRQGGGRCSCHVLILSRTE